MQRRRLLSALVLMGLACAGTALRAQPAQDATPPAEAAKREEMDRLFEALRDAPDEAAGLLVESRIRALWGQEATPAVMLLLRRGLRNVEAKLPQEALEDFDAAITLQPDLAEAWHLRSQTLASLGDANAAARDLQEVLRLEPRHFGALVTLSNLQAERGDWEGALQSFEAALAIHPKLSGGQERLRELRRRAIGEST